MSVLFTDLLDLLVAFSCQYLKALARLDSQYLKQATSLYKSLFGGGGEGSEEYFTLRERLRILNELNVIFN
jgi:plasmid replication initiation protein